MTQSASSIILISCGLAGAAISHLYGLHLLCSLLCTCSGALTGIELAQLGRGN